MLVEGEEKPATPTRLGSDTYIFEAGDGKEIIRGEGDGLGNNLIFRAPSGETYADADFQSNRGFLGDNLVLSEANDSDILAETS